MQIFKNIMICIGVKKSGYVTIKIFFRNLKRDHTLSSKLYCYIPGSLLLCRDVGLYFIFKTIHIN